MPTRTGWVLVAAAGIALITAVAIGDVTLATLGLTALGAVTGACILVEASAAGRGAGTRTLRNHRVPVGTPAVADVVVTSPPRRLAGLVTFAITDGYAGAAVTTELDPGDDAAERVVSYALATPQRGRVALAPAELRVSDLLGIAVARRALGEAADLTVVPRQVRLDAPAGHAGGDSRETAPASLSLTLDRLRDYVPGDEPRRIHWKASARRASLTVRDAAPGTSGPVEIVLDAGCTPATFELAVSVAASIAAGVHAAGGDPILMLHGTGRSAPARGLGAVLDRLATVVPDTPNALDAATSHAAPAGWSGVGTATDARTIVVCGPTPPPDIRRSACSALIVCCGAPAGSRGTALAVPELASLGSAWNRAARR